MERKIAVLRTMSDDEKRAYVTGRWAGGSRYIMRPETEQVFDVIRIPHTAHKESGR